VTYQKEIRAVLESTRDIRLMVLDPRHVEGYMRLTFGTLDHLSREGFATAAKDAARDVVVDVVLAEDTAQSYGL